MTKKLSVNCFFVEPLYADAFRHLVATYDEPSTYEEARERSSPELPTVEILYEETSTKQIGRFLAGTVGFDLWFSSKSTAFYFGQAWTRRLRTETVSQALDVRTRLQALRGRELHLVLKDGLRGISPPEAQELAGLSAQQEALFPLAAQVLGWNWAALTAPGRLRLATPNQVELMMQELTKLIAGQPNGLANALPAVFPRPAHRYAPALQQCPGRVHGQREQHRGPRAGAGRA